MEYGSNIRWSEREDNFDDLNQNTERLIADVTQKLIKIQGNYSVLLYKYQQIMKENRELREKNRNLEHKFSVMSLSDRVNKDECPLSTSVNIPNFHGLDYGSGMAYSFFYGYLNITLPNTGGKDESFLEFIKRYESKHNVEFEVRKLFILLPLSCYCPPTLQNESSPSIEEAKPLDEIEKDVAGVKKRSYKNSVYKIKKPGSDRKVYVSVEYATPLRTLKEVISRRACHSEIYEKYRKDIVSQFYLTLKQILRNNPDCGELCELIYYNDIDSDGKQKDVGKIILKRIKHMKESLKKKRD